MSMHISTDEYQYIVEKSPSSPYFTVRCEDDASLEIFLDGLELCGTNPYQEFPPPQEGNTVYIKPEVLSMWFSFEILNFGV